MNELGGDPAVRDGLPLSPPIFVSDGLTLSPSPRWPWLAGLATAELACVAAVVILGFAGVEFGHSGPQHSWESWQRAPYLTAAFVGSAALPVVAVFLLPRRPPKAYRPAVAVLTALALVSGGAVAARESRLRHSVGKLMVPLAEGLTVPAGLQAEGRPALGAVVTEEGVRTTIPEVAWFWRSPTGSSTACKSLMDAYARRSGWVVLGSGCGVVHYTSRTALFLQAFTPAGVAKGVPGDPPKAGIRVEILPDNQDH